MERLTRWNTVQVQIGAWSLDNFGFQQSKVDPDLILGSLAPLLGIFEETGEWAEAVTMEAWQDALGDVLVYLCDYASRENFLLADLISTVAEESLSIGPKTFLQIALGRLAHATLKRHQGIRGFDDVAKYHKERNGAVAIMLSAIELIAKNKGLDALEVLEQTWSKVVAKRNWKKNPTDAHKTE